MCRQWSFYQQQLEVGCIEHCSAFWGLGAYFQGTRTLLLMQGKCVLCAQYFLQRRSDQNKNPGTQA
jgi:hypothetical protein